MAFAPRDAPLFFGDETEPIRLADRVLGGASADASFVRNGADVQVAIALAFDLQGDDSERGPFALCEMGAHAGRRAAVSGPLTAPSPVGFAVRRSLASAQREFADREGGTKRAADGTSYRTLRSQDRGAVFRLALADNASQEIAIDIRYGRVEMLV